MVLSHRRLVAIVAQDCAHWGCRELYECFGCLVAVIRRALSALRQDDGISHGVCVLSKLWVKKSGFRYPYVTITDTCRRVSLDHYFTAF